MNDLLQIPLRNVEARLRSRLYAIDHQEPYIDKGYHDGHRGALVAAITDINDEIARLGGERRPVEDEKKPAADEAVAG